MSMTTQVYAATEEEIRLALHDAAAVNRFFSTENRATPMLDLDKSWHGLHYLLSGSAWESDGPLAFLVAGGEIIDLDPSSARVFWKNEVEAIDDALSVLTSEELRRRFKPQEMMAAEIYPEIWDRDPKEDDTLGELVSYFEKLKGFVHEARLQGRCLAINNEWPAAVTAAHVYISKPQANRLWKRLAPITIVAVCAGLTAVFYPLIPPSDASRFTEIAFTYFIAAVTLALLLHAIEWALRKWLTDKGAWLPNLKTGSSWASGHFVLVFLFVLAGKVFGFL